MKIQDWCEAQNLKATVLSKQLEDLGINITRQALSSVMNGKKQAPLDVALGVNELSGGLVTLEEMVIKEDVVPEEKEPVVKETEDLDDLLANL